MANSPEVEKAAAEEIRSAVGRIANNPAVTGIDPMNKGMVAYELTKELAPVLAHATNNEPFWQSRVSLGSITAIVAGAGAIGSQFQAGTYDVAVISAAVASILGGAFSLYGRWFATRPIGS